MLILDSNEIEYCQVIHKSKDKTEKGLIYSGKIFIIQKSFPKEELETAIKECREEYLDSEERANIPTLLIKEKTAVGIWMEDTNYKPTNAKPVESPRSSEKKSETKTDRISTKQLVQKMRGESGVKIKTRRYKLKFYHRCFLGNEAIDWIVEETKVSRDRALAIGQKMMDKKLFHHIVDEHDFKDEPLFYRFFEDEKKKYLDR